MYINGQCRLNRLFRTPWIFSALFLLHASLSAQISIEGTVLDAESGTMLPGANIVVQDTEIGTLTNFDGEFRLAVETLPVTLIISFIGYESAHVT